MRLDPGRPRRPSHESCQDLLPWYLNQTLDASESRAVEDHLEGCAACREEVVFLEALQTAARASEPPPIRDRFDEVVARVDRSVFGIRVSPLVRWLVVGQAAAIAALLAALLWPAAGNPPAGGYQTLSDPASAAPTHLALRLVFDERATEVEMRRLLESIGAQIVAGPNTVGAYTVRVDGDAAEAAGRAELLQRLRGEPLIRFAEAVSAPPVPQLGD